jgi:transcriptional regulator with XRE-family HTH domain
MSTTYSKFGSFVSRTRLTQGIATQGDLAKLIGTSQQSVSRWEAGTSRPSLKQLPKIASVLGVNEADLRVAAGYDEKAAIVSFDKPFPVEGLSPEAFERFAADLLQSLYPESKIHRAGGQGHKQYGTDVIMIGADGQRSSFQCKQVNEFGPKKVKAAIQADTTDAQTKVLVLARVASPDARAVIDDQKVWQLWDRDDLSRKIRQLPLSDQRRFVRIYFNSQYESLLGIPGGDSWETREDFFKAFEPQEKLFNHTWSLIGREILMAEVIQALEAAETNVVVLSGAGGDGKTRLLKSVLDHYALTHPTTKIRIATTTGDISKLSLEELGVGEKLIVVDDAHDRDDLQPLFEHAALDSGQTKILIATRPYGVSHIKAQASSYSFVDGNLNSIDIPPLSKEASESLARHVLEQLNGPVDMARQIAKLTYGCTLATVVGARIVAESGVHPAFVQNENRFRETLFGRFEDVVAGKLADRERPDNVRKVLGFISLLQPIEPDNRQLVAALESVEGIGFDEAQRIFKLLMAAGVLFKRGAKYRLSPDVLGDYLIESRFETHDGKSNGLPHHRILVQPVLCILFQRKRSPWHRS